VLHSDNNFGGRCLHLGSHPWIAAGHRSPPTRLLPESPVSGRTRPGNPGWLERQKGRSENAAALDDLGPFENRALQVAYLG